MIVGCGCFLWLLDVVLSMRKVVVGVSYIFECIKVGANVIEFWKVHIWEYSGLISNISIGLVLFLVGVSDFTPATWTDLLVYKAM